MKNTKKLRFVSMLSLLGIFMSASFIQAASPATLQGGGFDGNAPYGYVDVSGLYLKTDGYNQAKVNWVGTNGGNHRMWFRVVNSDGENKGSSLFNHPADGWIHNTTSLKNRVYKLESQRQSRGDPLTHVWGNWEP